MNFLRPPVRALSSRISVVEASAAASSSLKSGEATTPPQSVVGSSSSASSYRRRAGAAPFTTSASPDTEAPLSAPPPPPPIVWTTHRLTSDQILKVDKLFHQILWLDMIETAILVDVMNAKLGRVTMSDPQKIMLERHMNSFGLEGGSDSGGDGGASIAAAEAPKEDVVKLVDVKLVGYDDKQKIKVIKEVRSILGLGLKEAKEMVEGVPKILSKQIKPDQATELQDRLVAAGAQVEVG